MEKDHRLRKLAQNVLQNSVCLQPGEKIYIETSGTLTTDFLTVLIEETIRLGAVPFYYYNDTLLRNALLGAANPRTRKTACPDYGTNGRLCRHPLR